MGGGSSTLSPHQSSEITRKMKEEYEKCLKNNITNEKQKEILINSYNEIYITVINTPHYMIPKGIKTTSSNHNNHNNKGYQRGISKDISQQQVKTRRRSFDNNKTIKKASSNTLTSNSTNTTTTSNNLPILEKALSLQESQSSPGISSSLEEQQQQQQVDSWDSVNNQPSCILCGMVFSTMTKLETHVKYSVSFIFSFLFSFISLLFGMKLN